MSEKALFKNVFCDFCLEWGRFLIKTFIKTIFLGIVFLLIFFTFLGLLCFCKYTLSNSSPFLVGLIIGIVSITLVLVVSKSSVQSKVKQLEEIKEKMCNLRDPDKMYDKLELDVLQLRIGKELIKIADPDSDGLLLPKLVARRAGLIVKSGYMIPLIRILDDLVLDSYEYKFFVRENEKENGFVYPGKVMVKKSEFVSFYALVPEDAIFSINPIDKSEVMWISKEEAQNKKLKFLEPLEVILTHLEQICISNADKIISLVYVQKLLDHIENKIYEKTLLPSLISLVDLQNILINLVKQRVSIKDIEFILGKLADYARYTKDINTLTEKLVADLT